MIKNYFKQKRIGYYLSLSASLLCFITLILYSAFIGGEHGAQYFHGGVVACLLIGPILFIVCSFIKYARKISPIVLAVTTFMAFCFIISGSYMYFTEIFYDGFSPANFATMDKAYLFAFIFCVLAILMSSVGMYLKQDVNTDFILKKSIPNRIVNIGRISSKIIVHILTIAFGLVVVATPILMDNSASISNALNAETFVKIVYDDEGEAKEYFPTTHSSVAEMKQYTSNLIKEVSKEGTVLLKNDNALPLASGTKVSLFSVSSVDLVYSGAGSSSNKSTCANLKQGITAAGLTLNEDLWDWYIANYDTYKRTSTGDEFNKVFQLNDASWDEITTDSKTIGANGVAILVISRNAGEGVDLKFTGGDTNDLSHGNYLELSPKEIDILRNLRDQKIAGKYSKIIVLLNTANTMQCDFADDPFNGVDAVLWCGFFGVSGAYAVGDILAGNVSPSGKTSDVIFKKHMYNPVLSNFGAYSYTNRVAPTNLGDQYENSNLYCVYQEGIYNGYRYAETRYEDYVLGRENTGSFIYQDVISYPFGYGLTYSSFQYSNFSVSKTNNNYVAEVTVTNTGNVSAKEVAELYLQKPYTQYDIDHNIEKSSVELVDYKKTALLAPGESETVHFSVGGKALASYDAYGEGTYIVDEGDYYFSVSADSHRAINNILLSKELDNAQSARMYGEGDAELAYKFHLNFDAETYSRDEVTSTEITNQFDNADLNRYEHSSNPVTYISRNNWVATTKFGVDEDNNLVNNQVIIMGNEEMKEDILNEEFSEDTIEYPTYGSIKTMYSLVDLADPSISYNDPMWNDLLDQLTWDETVKLLKTGVRHTEAIASVGKPETIDHNGAVGPVKNYDIGANGYAVRYNDPDKSTSPNVYVCNSLVASTYNDDLAERYGKAMGEDCLWAGYNGLYGVGINIHRSSYGGRQFEYYSEDPLLTGRIAAYQAKGIQSFGVYCYMKHAIMNDMETHREGICIWANEQTIREIYLKPFEIAIKEADTYNVMSGFNRLGLKWNGAQGFINECLRKEFGMRGFAISDWCDYRTPYMTPAGAILGGNDLPDGDKYPNNRTFDEYRNGYGRIAQAMRESAHRILYVVAHSNAMNGLASNVDIIPIVPTWLRTYKKARNTVNGLFTGFLITYLVFALSYVTLSILESNNIYIWEKIFKPHKRKEQ